MNAGVLLWARSEWRRRWGALVLLAALVAVGGGATVAAVAAAQRTDTAFARLLNEARAPNLRVAGLNEEGSFADLDLALLDRVEQIDGVRGLWAAGFVAVAAEQYPNFFAIAIIERRGDAPRFIPIEGAGIDRFEDMAADDVMLNEAMQDQLGQGVGSTVRLRSLTPEQFIASVSQDANVGPPAGPTVNVRIVGVGRVAEDVSDAPDPFLLLPPAFYAKYHDAIGNCRCAIEINADPDAVDAVAAELAEIYPDASIERGEDYLARVSDTVALQRRAWWVIALAAALAGVVALFQAGGRFARAMAASDDTQLALGLTRRERRIGRFLVLAPVGLLGAAVAAGVAYVLSPVAPVGITKRAEPHPGLRWDAGVVVPGVAAVLVVSLAVVGIAAVVRRRRAERLDAAIGLGGPVLSLGRRLALGAGRGAIAGVVLSTAGLVGALTLQRSIEHVLATPALYGADFDATVFIDDGDDKRAIADRLALDPGIEAVGLVWAEEPGQNQTPVVVVGPGGSADVEPNAVDSIKGVVNIRLTTGRLPGRPDEVAVGSAVMDELGAGIGDRITATGARGAVQLTIVGDNLDPGIDSAGQGFSLTLDGLSALVEPAIEGTVVRFAPGTDHAETIERHAALYLAPMQPPSEVGNIGQLGGLPGRVGQVLALLGVVALLNAVVLTARQGRRPLAIHRALGFTSAQVIGAHLWQGAIAGVTGVVVGGAVGIVVGRAIHHELVANVGAVAETILPGAVWVVGLGTIAACLCAGAITALLALRHRPGAILHAE